MKKKLLSSLIVLIAGITIFISCKKDNDQPSLSPPLPPVPTLPSNKPPVANAGPDIVITKSSCAALHSTQLVGSGSSDPDDGIVYYEWKKISGPLEGGITNSADDTAIALDLRTGLHAFELLVRDSKGLSSRDTMIVDLTNWSMTEYDLDLTINGIYNFYNDSQDDYGDYEDLTIIEGTGNFDPIDKFTLRLYESADTATLSNAHSTWFHLSTAGGNVPSHGISGQGFVFLRDFILNGGGTFTSTFKVQGGTANACNPEVYHNLPSLIVTGSMDTTLHTVSLTIKGKTYF